MDLHSPKTPAPQRRLAELESQVADLESALGHFLQDATAAGETALRNGVSLARFGAGPVLRGLPGAIRQSFVFRVRRARRRRTLARLIDEATSGEASEFLEPSGWTSRTPIPTPKVEPRAAVVGDRLYVLGGFAPHEQLETSSWSYHPELDVWRQLPMMPVPGTHQATAAVGEEIWLVGGFAGHNPGRAITDVQVFNTVELEWRAGPPLPSHRGSMAAAAAGSRLHVVSGLGLDRKTDVTDHLVMDVSQPDARWESAAPLPGSGRNHHVAIEMNGLIYVLGGQVGHDGPLDDVATNYAYDPESDRWRRIADLPMARNHCEASTFIWHGEIVLAGGFGPWQIAPLPDLVSYSPEHDRWTSSGLLPGALWGAVTQRIGSQLIVTCGYGASPVGLTGQTWSAMLVD